MTEIFFSVENSYNVNFPEGEGGGGYSGFQVTDMIVLKIPRASSKTPKKFPGTKLTRKENPCWISEP